jgi:hypothetical protein
MRARVQKGGRRAAAGGGPPSCGAGRKPLWGVRVSNGCGAWARGAPRLGGASRVAGAARRQRPTWVGGGGGSAKPGWGGWMGG